MRKGHSITYGALVTTKKNWKVINQNIEKILQNKIWTETANIFMVYLFM